MNQFFSIIIDIFDRINGRKLLNINRSVHVPCIRSRLHIIIRAIVNIEFRPCNIVYIYFLIVCPTGKPAVVQHGVRPNAYITKRMRPVHEPIRLSHSRNIFGFSDGIPSALIYRQACLVARNFDVHINVSRLFARSALHRITIQFHPIRQRPHRQQIDEHQRRHQNGYKAFYFIPHCLILLFHLEAALPLLPERSKRICGQTVRRLKKKISEKRARHSCAACSVGSVFQPKISALTRQ